MKTCPNCLSEVKDEANFCPRCGHDMRVSIQPKFLRKDLQGKNTYELYQCNDAESARQFLLTKRVDKPLYYIIVETPEGNWGMDIQGLYLERLLPWQIQEQSEDCLGHIFPMSWNQFGLESAAKKLNDNFIVKIECGSCNYQWFDGVRYQNTTIVRCPKCKKLNKVDSGNIHAILLSDTQSQGPDYSAQAQAPVYAVQPQAATYPAQPQTPAYATKKCPYCANEIHAEAIVCQYCNRDLRLPFQEQDPTIKKATSDASSALTSAIIGIFCFGIILEPIAIARARSAKKVLRPGDKGYGQAQAAEIIGWIFVVIWALSLLSYFFLALGGNY